MKSDHIIFSELAAYAVNHRMFDAHSISVQLQWTTCTERKFQILPDYAGICQIFPENSRFCRRNLENAGISPTLTENIGSKVKP